MSDKRKTQKKKRTSSSGNQKNLQNKVRDYDSQQVIKRSDARDSFDKRPETSNSYEKNAHISESKKKIVDINEHKSRKTQKSKDKSGKRQEKKRIGSGAVTLIILLSIAILFLAGPMAIRAITGNMIRTEVLKNGVVEDSFNTQAIVIREEQVVKSDIAGICIPTYSEGEKVSKGVTVATVISEASKELTDELKSLNVRISKARDEIMSEQDFLNEEIRNVDEKIKEGIRGFSEIFFENDLSSYDNTYNSIKILLDQKRDLINNDTQISSSYIEDLIKRRDGIQNTLKDKMKNIVNNVSGVVSYSVDGFEDSYKPAIIGNISTVGFDKMITDIGKTKKVADSAYVKIVTGISYYLVCNVEYKNTLDIKAGDWIDIRVNENNAIISMQIDQLRVEGNRAILVLKSEKALSEITSFRTVNIDIILRRVEGIKIPQRALVNINHIENTGEIAVVKSGYSHYVYAKILILKDDYAIIENLDTSASITFSVNDFIVIDPGKGDNGKAI